MPSFLFFSFRESNIIKLLLCCDLFSNNVNHFIFSSLVEEEEHTLACLLSVFVAVSIPKLARNDNSFYRASLEGHSNNIHCIAAAVNNIFGALFTICGQGDIEDRMKEFLAVRNSYNSLLLIHKVISVSISFASMENQ